MIVIHIDKYGKYVLYLTSRLTLKMCHVIVLCGGIGILFFDD